MKKILIALSLVLAPASTATAQTVEDVKNIVDFCEEAHKALVAGKHQLVLDYMEKNYTAEQRAVVATICYAYSRGRVDEDKANDATV